jgi:AraC-like DNA-binding protein
MASSDLLGTLGRFLSPRVRKLPPSPRDLEFLAQFRKTVEEHLPDGDFTTSAAAANVELSRMHLNRKLRALTGQSTHKFIQTARLEAARRMLSEQLPIGEVARAVGFKSTSHFSRVFRQRFGHPPSSLRPQQSPKP